MPYPTLILILASAVVLLVFFVLKIEHMRKSIEKSEQKIIALHREKIDKIPALVEIMTKHTTYTDIFLEIIALHRLSIISNISSVYDLLESGSRIHREFLFLMKISSKMRDLSRDGNFLYVRDFVIFYENAISKELLILNREILRYNDFLKKKDLLLVGLLLPYKRRVPLS